MPERIIFENVDGTVGVIVPAPGVAIKDCMEDIPATAVSSEVVPVEDIPSDRTFRNAWKYDATKKIDIDMVKATEITHDRRRNKRDEEFAPLDIKATIPAEAEAAEAARVVIRRKYDDMQIAIDNGTTAEDLKGIIEAENL